ncbi:MAG: DUF2452 domain-containing protein [Spirochaetes bacterium]|nr:DUF2452 domain-containing protein [Spirochaetota bacterium]
MINQHNKKEPEVKNKNTLPYPSRTLDPPISIVEQAKEIEKAEKMLSLQVNGKLELIVKQIRFLQEEARKIIEEAHHDLNLHKVKCNFVKIPGETIHLYEKADHSLYFSRLSFQDWQGEPPHVYKGSYQFREDHSFVKISSTE